MSALRQQVTQRREGLRAELTSAVEEEADPLAAYDNFVNWTLQNYSDPSESGLLELLEETVRKFKDDVRYKYGDLRYVKLWILFANHVEKPAEVYAYMLQEGIGKPYALFFEEYAEALEREERFAEAETIVTLGIRTQAKPLKRLQAFHDAYTSRRAAGKQLPAKVSPFRDIRMDTCPYTVNVIRAYPLKNMTTQCAGTPSHPDVSMTTTQAVPTRIVRPNPYAHLHAPLAPGKRPEKLQFDLTLLLDSDGTEYCFEEARARHLGLLGKKWLPPPPPNPTVLPQTGPSDNDNTRERSIKVDFNDQGSKSGRGARRQSVTVTINTKQALDDVFDMYNSPVRGREDAGSCDVEARTRIAESDKQHNVATSKLLPFRDGNEEPPMKPRPFQPYVDQRRENVTPGPLKFTSVATKTPGSHAITPNATRRALAAKEITTPVPVFKVVRPEQQAATTMLPPDLRSFAEEQEPEEIDVFGGDDVTVEQYTEDFTNPPPPPPAPRSFVPFVDEKQDMPDSRKNEDVSAPVASKILKFQVHRDENAPQGSQFNKPNLTSQTPSDAPFRPMTREEDIKIGNENTSDKLWKRLDNEYEERQRFGKNGRFADFDVMTPITERTFECTTSTRIAGTPGSERSSMFDKGFVALDAQDAAERLAAELLEDEGKERQTDKNGVRSPLLGPELLDAQHVDECVSSSEYSFFDRPRTVPFRVSEGFTIELDHNNLLSSIAIDRSISHDPSPTFTAESGLKLPNPCVPSDPAILSKIMSIFPLDANHRELGHAVVNQMEKLRRFAEKRARRGSGASSSGRTSDGSDKLVLELDRDRFECLDKLGEGGFGAVFMARRMNRDNEALEERDEDVDRGLVAIKAVRPTNRWESFVLRRVISAIPHDLRRSIIRPHVLYAYKDESYLILDLCQQGTLLEIVNRAAETHVAQPGGGVDELLVMFFTVELLRIVQGLHDQGFIHGDLKIDNCMIRLEDTPGGPSAWSSEYSPTGANGWAHKGIKLIDFGRTIDTKLFPAGHTFIADWKTDARDCIEMREGRPWTFQTDYSGLACIVHCMLFGKYIETVEMTGDDGMRRIKPSQPMKRYWQVNLWNRLFDALLNPCQLRPDGSLPVTKELAALRMELETWIQANCNKGGKILKGMLKKIEIAAMNRSPRK